MDTTDDFERLGRAVARVLRESFTTAADVRAQAGPAPGELDAIVAEMRSLPARFQDERDAEAKSLAAAVAAARQEMDATLEGARQAAEAIRSQALADAKAIVDGAAAEVARARELVAEERVRLDTELKTLVRDVRRAVSNLEAAAKGDHEEMLDRASTEARMILRQARLHHRSTAKEVDRMIEAAAAEAASLRKTALNDAARVAARVRGVVNVPTEREAEVDELPLRDWRRPTAAAPDSSAGAADGEAKVVEHATAQAKRRPGGRRLAS